MKTYETTSIAMKITKKALFLALVFAASEIMADATVSNISFAQRWPWNGKLDISYTVSSAEASPTFRLAFFGQLGEEEPFALVAIEGEGACGVTLGSGVKRITWDATEDIPGVQADDLKVGVIALDVTDEANYLVLNLDTYRMTYRAIGPGVTNDVCKTSKLWLKKVHSGTFLMGSPSDEPGREPRIKNSESQHAVTITKNFYIGVFELTEAQFEKINNETISDSKYPKSISYKNLRGNSCGATWPTATDHRVDAGSFFGKLRAKTGLIFDLPTEAQWELAIRDKDDGTYHGGYVWNDGTSFLKERPVTNIVVDAELGVVTNITAESYVDWSDLQDLAWIKDTSGGDGSAHEVGLKKPSLNGLYDMHGNLWEWCLDALADTLGTAPVTDPVGPAPNAKRVRRGGSFWKSDTENLCRMAMRVSEDYGSNGRNSIGARIVLIP